MPVRLRQLSLASLALTAILVGIVCLTSSGGATTTPSNDCRAITATPTVTGTPWPTPPYTPYYDWRICNDTGDPANDLHITLNSDTRSLDPVYINAPGCPEPGYTYNTGAPPYKSIDVVWSSACVDPGEAVFVHFDANCNTISPPCGDVRVDCYYWTLDGQALPSVSPAPVNPGISCQNPNTPTPSPGPCPDRGTPPVTAPPTPFDLPEQRPPSGPPSTFRDMITTNDITYCNNSSESASDLHIHFAHPYSSLEVFAYPPGCPPPSIGPSSRTLDEFDMDIDWGQACVEPGETLSFQMYFACNAQCAPPDAFCYTWTLNGEELDSEGACPDNLRGWGDNNCDNATNPLDALAVLRTLAGLSAMTGATCPGIGSNVMIAGHAFPWGDADCNQQLGGGDVFDLLSYLAVPHVSDVYGCPPLGRRVVVTQSG